MKKEIVMNGRRTLLQRCSMRLSADRAQGSASLLSGILSLVGSTALVALLSLGFVRSAGAQPYPAKLIRLVVPFAPGGPNDISARLIADALSKSLQQSVIVDNRPGAGGNIGAEAVAKAAPDGATLFWAQAATHGINPSLYRKLGYDAIKSFTPVALIVSEPLVLVANVSSPWADAKDLIKAAKAEPGKLHFGSGGLGTTPHMSGELLAVMAGATFVHVPYRGNAPAVVDTIAGRVQFVFDGINGSIGHIRAGQLKALAVTGRARTAALPDVPTLAEIVPGYEVTSWGGIVAPAGTPTDVVARLSQELIAVGERPDLQRRFTELGAHLSVSTPSAMDDHIRAQMARWRAVIEQTGIAVD
jgi:tripartite-type tricarboxylate transporter receptor subunit TctC